MFASKDASALPWQAGHLVDVYRVKVDGKPASVVVRRYVQHNAPNPILLAFRSRAADEALDLWVWGLDALASFGGWAEWDSPRHPLHSLTLATDMQADHARSVLTRLANFPA